MSARSALSWRLQTRWRSHHHPSYRRRKALRSGIWHPMRGWDFWPLLGSHFSRALLRLPDRPLTGRVVAQLSRYGLASRKAVTAEACVTIRSLMDFTYEHFNVSNASRRYLGDGDAGADYAVIGATERARRHTASPGAIGCEPSCAGT